MESNPSGIAEDATSIVTADPASEEPIDDPRVAAAIERLEDLPGLPVAEHVEVFTDVHARLTEALGGGAAAPQGA